MQEKLRKYLSEVGLQVVNFEIEEGFENSLNSILKKKSNVKENNEMPYKLKEILLYNNFSSEDIYRLVDTLHKIVEFLQKEIGSDWTGIYKKLNTQTGKALVKLAHQGIASKLEFPLTEEFAKHSNNSTVGLTGKAVLVDNVKKHLKNGKPYYRYDLNSQSELCMPILLGDKEVIGILNLESFKENFFDDKKIIKAAIACMILGDQLQ